MPRHFRWKTNLVVTRIKQVWLSWWWGDFLSAKSFSNSGALVGAITIVTRSRQFRFAFGALSQLGVQTTRQIAWRECLEEAMALLGVSTLYFVAWMWLFGLDFLLCAMPKGGMNQSASEYGFLHFCCDARFLLLQNLEILRFSTS